MNKKIVVLVILLLFFFLSLTPGNVYAGSSTRVTIFISFGFVIGGATAFFSFAYSERYSLQKKQLPESDEAMYVSAFDPMKFQDSHTLADDDSDAIGMLKFLSW